MGRTRNIPQGHTEQRRFRFVGALPTNGNQQAVQISFFAGYEAGKVTHYIACHFKGADGSSQFWAKACNGRNKALWYDTNLADCEADPDYEEAPLDDLACKADWMKVA